MEDPYLSSLDSTPAIAKDPLRVLEGIVMLYVGWLLKRREIPQREGSLILQRCSMMSLFVGKKPEQEENQMVQCEKQIPPNYTRFGHSRRCHRTAVEQIDGLWVCGIHKGAITRKAKNEIARQVEGDRILARQDAARRTIHDLSKELSNLGLLDHDWDIRIHYTEFRSGRREVSGSFVEISVTILRKMIKMIKGEEVQ